MSKTFKNIYSILLLIFSIFFSIFFSSIHLPVEAQEDAPPVHVLMPAYNAAPFIQASLQSVLDQGYPELKLLIQDDGSTDTTVKNIQETIKANPALEQKIYIRSTPDNRGVAQTRNELIEWSKDINPDAYIFWLDSDDQYTDTFFIREVIQQMQATKADICLFNFSVIYEEESQRENAAGLIQEKERLAEIIQDILSHPGQFIIPSQLPNLLEVTSLGWVKCYSPAVMLPKPTNCSFEDFVYMAALLEANRITALPPEKEPIQYLRRSTSICGQRFSQNFTHDIPTQLTRFFTTVLEQSQGTASELQKTRMAQDFVHRKINQYRTLLKKIIAERSHPDIDDSTFEVYQAKTLTFEDSIQASMPPPVINLQMPQDAYGLSSKDI